MKTMKIITLFFLLSLSFDSSARIINPIKKIASHALHIISEVSALGCIGSIGIKMLSITQEAWKGSIYNLKDIKKQLPSYYIYSLVTLVTVSWVAKKAAQKLESSNHKRMFLS